MGSFSDHNIAGQMRDTIERIARGVIRSEGQTFLVGRVFSKNTQTMTAKVLLVGESIENLMTVNFAQDKIPSSVMETLYDTLGLNSPGDIVRIAGKPGAYFILDFVSGKPYVQEETFSALHENPSLEGAWKNNGTEPVGYTFFWNGGPVTESPDYSDYAHGSASVRFFRPGNDNARLHSTTEFAVTAGEQITMGCYAKTDTPDGLVELTLISNSTGNSTDFFGGGTFQTTTYNISGGWTKYETSFFIPIGHSKARVTFLLRSASNVPGYFWIDNTFSSRPSTVPWTPANSPNIFASGWGNYGSIYAPVGYRKVADKVEVRGLAARSSGTSITVLTLPAGYRPTASLIFSIMNDNNVATRLDVNPDGTCVLPVATAFGYTSFNGVEFSIL